MIVTDYLVLVRSTKFRQM